MSKSKARRRDNRPKSSAPGDQRHPTHGKKSPKDVSRAANPPRPSRLRFVLASLLLAIWLILLIVLATFSAS